MTTIFGMKPIADRPARRDPDRAGRPPRRARLLPRDLPRAEVRARAASRGRLCRTTTRARGAGTLRGLHAQLRRPAGQARARGRGRDLRRGGRHPAAARPPSASGSASRSRGENFRQLWVPPGFAHGFCVLSERAARRVQVHGLLRPGGRDRDRLERSGDRHRMADRRPHAVGQGPGGPAPRANSSRAVGISVRGVRLVRAAETADAASVHAPTQMERGGVMGSQPVWSCLLAGALLSLAACGGGNPQWRRPSTAAASDAAAAGRDRTGQWGHAAKCRLPDSSDFTTSSIGTVEAIVDWTFRRATT